MSINLQLDQLYQIIHIHPVNIFNNSTVAGTIPSWGISLFVVIILLLHHKENEDQGEFMGARFEGAIYKFAFINQRGNN